MNYMFMKKRNGRRYANPIKTPSRRAIPWQTRALNFCPTLVPGSFANQQYLSTICFFTACWRSRLNAAFASSPRSRWNCFESFVQSGHIAILPEGNDLRNCGLSFALATTQSGLIRIRPRTFTRQLVRSRLENHLPTKKWRKLGLRARNIQTVSGVRIEMLQRG